VALKTPQYVHNGQCIHALLTMIITGCGAGGEVFQHEAWDAGAETMVLAALSSTPSSSPSPSSSSPPSSMPGARTTATNAAPSGDSSWHQPLTPEDLATTGMHAFAALCIGPELAGAGCVFVGSAGATCSVCLCVDVCLCVHRVWASVNCTLARGVMWFTSPSVPFRTPARCALCLLLCAVDTAAQVQACCVALIEAAAVPADQDSDVEQDGHRDAGADADADANADADADPASTTDPLLILRDLTDSMARLNSLLLVDGAVTDETSGTHGVIVRMHVRACVYALCVSHACTCILTVANPPPPPSLFPSTLTSGVAVHCIQRPPRGLRFVHGG